MEAASGITSLGRLADQVALATVRYQSAKALGDSDRKALGKAEEMLRFVAALRRPEVTPYPGVFQTMAPFGAVDETVETVTSASETDGVLAGDVLSQLADDVGRIRQATADDAGAERVRSFFDRLSIITLGQSSSLAGTIRSEDPWIPEASHYSIS
jgi:hypothetical protein